MAVPDEPQTVNPLATLVLLSSVLFKVKSPPRVFIVTSAPSLTADAKTTFNELLLDPTFAFKTVEVDVKVRVPLDLPPP